MLRNGFLFFKLLNFATMSTKFWCLQGDDLLQGSSIPVFHCCSHQLPESTLSLPTTASAPVGLLQPLKAQFPFWCLKWLCYVVETAGTDSSKHSTGAQKRVGVKLLLSDRTVNNLLRLLAHCPNHGNAL